jgi:hypothetical protein
VSVKGRIVSPLRSRYHPAREQPPQKAAEVRNGIPEQVPYEWNRAGRERERQAAEQLAAIRARIAAKHGGTEG